MPGLLTQDSDMAAPSSFSYAQAAKGQGSTPSNASPNPASPAQNPSTQPDDTKSTSLVEKPLDATEVSIAPDEQLNGADRGDKESVQGVSESVTSESVSGRRAETRRDEDISRLERPWRRNDKGTRNSSTMTRSTEENDSRKPRRGKKGRNAHKGSGDQAPDAGKEQDAELEAPKIPLSEAPIPSVNIWQQRKEAQLAKTQTTPSEPAEATGTSAAQAPAKPSAIPATAQENVSANGVKPPRRTADGGRSEMNGSRGSRAAGEKGGKDGKGGVPPPVEDAVSWPTPETSTQDQQKKPAEKTDRSEKDVQEDAGSAKRQKDKWVHLPFTASASFETPLPQLRSSKPRTGHRERGSNGPRSGTGTQPGEKAAAAGAQSNKPAESSGRPRDVSNGANGSAPASSAAKRASVDPANTREQRRSAAPAPAEKAKEAASSHGLEHAHTGAKERPEGRNERGRGGGYRGRGGHHAVNSQSQHQHSASSIGGAGFGGVGSLGGKAHGPYSPPPRQGAHGQMFMPPPQRGGRGGRNGGGANYHRMSLPNGRIPPVQTHYGTPYEYPMGSMNPMPFQQPQYWDSVMFNMLRSQIEYYFSIENLCKDMYLRKRMDSQGFVPLHFIAAFKRVRELSGEAGLNMVRAVCEESMELDYVVGEDDMERIRRRDNWQQWLVRWEDRDEGARNNGPNHVTFKTRNFQQFPPQFNGMAPMPYGAPPSPSYPGVHGSEQAFQSFMAAGPQNPVQNGVPATQEANGPPKQLSANVPDFSPSGSAPVDNGLMANGSGQPNGVHAADGSASLTTQS